MSSTGTSIVRSSRFFSDVLTIVTGRNAADSGPSAVNSSWMTSSGSAVASGDLDAERLDHYLRLDQELDATARRREGRVASRAQKQFYKNR